MASHYRDLALRMDEQDVLAHFRQRFVITDPDLIYLDGNSLGRMPITTSERLKEVVQHEWGQNLIQSWNEGWIDAPSRIGDKIAPIIGAAPGEVLLADSTSVNLFKMAVAALLAQPGRHKIVTDDLNFPSDLYVLQSVCHLLGSPYRVEVVCSTDGIYGPTEKLQEAIDNDTALLALSHTTFKSGYTYNMQLLTEVGHKFDALVLWDLSHSAGVVPISLNNVKADLAVGCTYKYLNGGPGAPAFLYVRRDLQDYLNNPIAGWMGHNDSFAFELDYKSAPGLRRFLSGTPPILSMSAIEPALDMLLDAGIDQIRAKSLDLTQYLLILCQEILEPIGFRINSPKEKKWRGSHISLGHDEGQRIDMALIEEMNVVPDFREPDNIRLGLSPLYTSFIDIHTAVTRIQTVVNKGLYKSYNPGIGSVT